MVKLVLPFSLCKSLKQVTNRLVENPSKLRVKSYNIQQEAIWATMILAKWKTM